MCGIAGFVNLRGEPADAARADAMIERVRYRGPDERGVYRNAACALAHVRLSIVDVAAGQQPMTSADGRYCIVFNGEIFNHAELRAELQARGRNLRTRCDTEVILELYAERGAQCVHALNGQWAFAIWDTRERSLFLSRDRMGIRPLYYAKTAAQFLFASEIKAVLAHPNMPRRLDPRAIDDVLTLWSIVAPRTAFEGVCELPPGHSLVLRAGELKLERFWQLEYAPDDCARSEGDYAEELRALLVDSTRLRFTSADVPVGAYLSGGLDSTLIASVVRRCTEAPLHTFSVAFEDAEFDESAFQRQAIEHLRVEHRSVLCRKQDIAECFADVVWHAEQPLVRTAPAPMYRLAQLVRSHGYKVVLTGEGADELFGGYDIFKEAKLRRLCAERPHSQLRPLLLRRLYPYIPALQRQSPDLLREFFRARPEDLNDPFFSHLPRWELTRTLRRFYSPAMRDALGAYDSRRAIEDELPAAFAAWPAFCRAQFLETRYLLPGYLLSSQGDRMAMAHGVEGRFPFLDYRVVQFAARLPLRLKMAALREKYLLKRAAGDWVPDALRKRTKQPYRAPEALSFYAPETGGARAEYVEAMLSREKLERAAIWNPEPVQQLVNKARRGKVIGVRDGMALVSILSTQLLFEQFVERLGRLDHAAAS